ncbi:MAG TPA: Hsp20/alpha crystallin family protein [Candidatus Paceibacterota bacterium]|nr:Hsp20/alpha crystallin family protein [Candidatus Paceibacterota bacterium]
MAISKIDPFHEIERFFNDEDFFLPAVRRTFGPPMDISQTADDVIVELQIPKMDPKNVHVRVENGVLTIEGKSEETEEEKDKNYIRREIRSGSFRRMVSLPSDVQADQAAAHYENGVLKITMPKSEHTKPKDIEIKIATK